MKKIFKLITISVFLGAGLIFYGNVDVCAIRYDTCDDICQFFVNYDFSNVRAQQDQQQPTVNFVGTNDNNEASASEQLR